MVAAEDDSGIRADGASYGTAESSKKREIRANREESEGETLRGSADEDVVGVLIEEDVEEVVVVVEEEEKQEDNLSSTRNAD